MSQRKPFKLPIIFALGLLLMVSLYLLGAERLRIRPSRETIEQGEGAVFRLTTTGDADPDRSLQDFIVEGLPPGVVAMFDPEDLTIPGSGSLTIDTSDKTSPGSYQLIIIGTVYSQGAPLGHVVDRVRLQIRGPVSPKKATPAVKDTSKGLVAKKKR